MIKGVDISSYQGNPTFPLPVDFVICKATEGTGYVDPTFTSNIEAIRKTNSGLGFYHFARPDLGNSAINEADFFIQTIGKPLNDEILALDFEVNYADPVTWCAAFLDRVNAKLGCKPLLYLNDGLVKKCDWTPVIQAGYGLWLADYDGIENDAVNTPWPEVAMKQWSSTGQIAGIKGNVDLDTFFGDLNMFKAYGYHDFMEPKPAVDITDQTLLPFGGDIGTIEFQAARSLISDLKRDNAAYTSHIKEIDGEVATIQIQMNTLTSTNANLTTDLKEAQQTILALQKTPVSQPLESYSFGALLTALINKIRPS